jgi:hypothetical protein
MMAGAPYLVASRNFMFSIQTFKRCHGAGDWHGKDFSIERTMKYTMSGCRQTILTAISRIHQRGRRSGLVPKLVPNRYCKFSPGH